MRTSIARRFGAIILATMSCASGEETTDYLHFVHRPTFDVVSRDLVPDADLTPSEWTPIPSTSPLYQVIDDIDPVIDDNIWSTTSHYRARFGMSDFTGYPTAVISTLVLRMNVGTALHQGEEVELFVRLYAGGEEIGYHVFDYCCGPVDPDPYLGWEHTFSSLSLDISEINSLEIEVEAVFWNDISTTHLIKIFNMYVEASFSSGGGGGKGPDPNES